MKRVIINADDFGLSPGVNRGIVEAHDSGILTSTTLMVNMPACDEAVALAEKRPRLGVGLHLNIVRGTPVSDPALIPTLVVGNGAFPGRADRVLLRLRAGRIRRDELETEIEAQLVRFTQRLGDPTHFDSEKNLHAFSPFADVAVAVAAKHGIRCLRCPAEERLCHGTATTTQRFKAWLMRRAALSMRRTAAQAGLLMPDHFTGILHSGDMTADRYREVFDSLSDGVTEIMCHPGYAGDAQTPDIGPSYLARKRETDLQGLLDQGLRKYATEREIDLTHFGRLGAPASH